MTETQDKKQGTVLVKNSPFVFTAIVIGGCLVVSVVLVVFFKDIPALVVSVVLACGVATLLYCILGGVSKAEFDLGVLKVGGSAAVLLGGSWFFNSELDPQLEKIRLENRIEQFGFDFNKHAAPSDGWFALNKNTGIPVKVEFTNPVTNQVVATVQIPDSADLPLKLVSQESTGRYLVTGSEAEPKEGFGYVRPSSLIGWETGTVYGFQRLYIAREGYLPSGMKRRWGNTVCRHRSMPFEIMAVRFRDGYADYDIRRCNAVKEAPPDYSSSLRSGDVELVELKIERTRRSFLVAVVAADHTSSNPNKPPWSAFLVIEINSPH